MFLKRRHTDKKPPTIDHFFLPDLCQWEAVFLLLLMAQLMVVVLVLASANDHDFWTKLAITTLFVQWVVLLTTALLCRLRLWLSRQSLTAVTAIIFAMVLALILAVDLLGAWAFYGNEVVESISRMDGISRFRHLLIGAIMTGIVLRYFYLQHQLIQQKQAELMARLQALQSRIHPHFLFNSMNSIASLIASNPKVAEEAVEDLAELFRASLDEVASEIPLTDELHLCKRYAHMEELRLGKRLTMNWQVDNMPKWIKIPILTIQPLVENAVYHGIQPLVEGGVVDVMAKYESPYVCIEVRNPIPNQQAPKHEAGNRMALDNIQARLTALYGQEAKLHTETRAGTYIASLRYPYAEDRFLKGQH